LRVCHTVFFALLLLLLLEEPSAEPPPSPLPTVVGLSSSTQTICFFHADHFFPLPSHADRLLAQLLCFSDRTRLAEWRLWRVAFSPDTVIRKRNKIVVIMLGLVGALT
jgi:hypothetical protein